MFANFKRYALLFMVNILIVVTLSIVLSLLGVGHYMTAYGINYQSLAIFCLVWGMGGAFISLALSKVMAKWMMGLQMIDERSGGQYAYIVRMVHEMARKAKLPAMPEVAVYDSPEINAFATGPTKGNSLVAVSTGLLSAMDKDEVEGVIAHEVGHIANGDMVTMTLIQGVINAFVMFLARVLTFFIEQALRNNSDREEGSGAGGLGMFARMGLIMLFEIIFGILGSIVVAWFSRQREYRADAYSAKIAGKEKMIRALQALQRQFENIEPDRNTAMAAMKISSKNGWLALFSTHPQLQDRIDALRNNRKLM